MATFILTNAAIDLRPILKVLSGEIHSISLSEECKNAIQKSAQFLQDKISAPDAVIYGVNTGFGFLADTRIPNDKLEELQLNLIRSHACGTGEELSAPLIRLMLFLKIRSLSLGFSGVRVETVERLIAFFNEGIHPVVFNKGSLGASGDLAPLAHLSLPLIGEGEIRIKGEKFNATEIEKRTGLKPLKLGAKEGLALLNGTQFMLACGLNLICEAKTVFEHANKISYLSLEAWSCRSEPFHEAIHRIRPHKGQVHVASKIWAWLESSPSFKQEKKQVQDPYSFRCIPQVHGAVLDAIHFCENAFVTELNSATDNPNIFPEEDLIISGGNFHGEPIAIPLDVLAIAMTELGSISERRTFLLLSGQRELPLFLVANPGLQSGLMIVQYTAAALVSENKILAHPATADSITSSNGQEDHVSMGAIGAVKALATLANLKRILGIELICASQGLFLKENAAISSEFEPYLTKFRKEVPPIESDRILSGDIERASQFLNG